MKDKDWVVQLLATVVVGVVVWYLNDYQNRYVVQPEMRGHPTSPMPLSPKDVVVSPDVVAPVILPVDPKVDELMAQVRVAEARLQEIQKQRLAEETRVAALQRQQQLEQQQQAEQARLLELQRQREAEEKRLAELELQRKQQEAEEARRFEAAAKPLISGRYRDNGDGTVTDTTTNLMWKRCSEGQTWQGDTCVGQAVAMTWYDAMPDGKQKGWSSFAGYSDWRMPSIEELRFLVYCSNGTPSQEAWVNSCSGKNSRNGDNYQKPTIDLQVFPNTPDEWFWASSPNAVNAGGAWVVSFYYGDDSSYYRSSGSRVRLVRAGQ